MKARIPPIRKATRNQINVSMELANTEIRHAAYRLYLISCLTLRDMGFGPKRIAEFISLLTERMEKYGEKREGEVADMKLFQQVEKEGCIPIEEKIKQEMLEYENKRFWGK